MPSSQPIGIGGPQVTVKVTPTDIAWGVKGDSSRCMVARAIAREVGDASRIEVDTQTIRFTVLGVNARYAYLTPLRVQQYVAAFDAGEPIEPFEFRLRSPMRLRRQLLTPEGVAAMRMRRLTEAKPAKAEGKVLIEAANQHATTPVGKQSVRDAGDVRVTPRVFKSSKRTYGSRVLRINQPKAST